MKILLTVLLSPFSIYHLIAPDISIENTFQFTQEKLHFSSVTFSGSIHDKPQGGVYFVSRNATIESGNEMLVHSIRSIDMTGKSGNSSITSRGEGWLNKDSLPVGKWQFYATGATGKEYLFKSGHYRQTHPGMFEVTGIDSADLAKNYHLSLYQLQQQQAQTIPFIKMNTWEYFHPGGATWKKRKFKQDKIPISVGIVLMDQDEMEKTQLIIQLKENLDEWEE